jgi:hypothetical protein
MAAGVVSLAAIFLCSCTGTGNTDFAGIVPADLTRTWIGPEYHSNRLADWRIDSGRLECIESRPRFPLRTVHLLTRSLKRNRGSFTVRILTGQIDAAHTPSEDSWTGFLIGCGGGQVDYRLSALTHHKPAADGGLLAVVNGHGIPSFRDNSIDYAGEGTWNVSGSLDPADVPVCASETTNVRESRTLLQGSAILELHGEYRNGACLLVLNVMDQVTGELVGTARIDNVPEDAVDGSIALVSHLGPVDSRNGFWFRELYIAGSKVAGDDSRVFGPVLGTQYTLSRGILKLTAQMPTIAEADWVEDSYTATFRIENWDGSEDIPYRIAYALKTGGNSPAGCFYEGIVRAEPTGDQFVVAAFTGNKNYTGGLRWNHSGIWFPHREIIDAVAFHDPDFLFFSGDQVYEGDLTPAITAPFEKAMHDYLYKWYRWYWAFRDLTRDRPSVSIPDDHDVYHGNIWGAGGKRAEAVNGLTAQDSGGYKMSPRFVNAVHRTQTSHLPDPFDPTPVEQGISVYYSRIDYGGMSFAVIADRQWKSSPMVSVPEGEFVNGWPRNPGFDPAVAADVPGAVLLGERQLRFLRQWASDWSEEAWMKVVLSQTIFSNVSTIPESATSGAVFPSLPILPKDEYPDDFKKASDGDSNAWPQTGRNKALREMRRAFAIHIAGDQHLGSTIQYGIDDWGDAGFAFCVPSVGNTWPRRWFPPQPGLNRKEDSPQYTGDFLDGFGNRMTVHAVSNPYLTGIEPTNLNDRAPGYGIVRFNRDTRRIVIECWPRWVDPASLNTSQYDGWPVEIDQQDNYGRSASAYLPVINVEGALDPVIQVLDEQLGEIVYTLRISGVSFQPKVFRSGSYTVRVGDPDTGSWKVIEGLSASPEQAGAGSVTVVIP